jgi:nucleoside-diphosphate-sugar epimerase
LRFKHAFVTGATGIVGIPLCRKLSEMGIRVTAYSRSSGDLDLPSGVNHVKGDIQHPVVLAEAAQGADVIFHLAAAVHGSASAYVDFQRINVAGTENVIRVARDTGAKLVHVSTVNVDGFRQGNLRDAYAATKSRAEELVAEAVSKDGLDAVTVRPATVFGSEPGRAGLIVDRLFFGSLKILPAPSRMISPVWAGDLATALINAAVSGIAGQVYTIAGPATSTADFVTSICESAGVSPPRFSIPAWVIVVPLQIAWWGRVLTRWTPLVSVEAVRNGSVHEGTQAANDLAFSYTSISEIFSSSSSRYKQ